VAELREEVALPAEIPRSFGTWPIMMVRPRPNMNPAWTPAAMKRDTKPSRSTPSASSTMPTRMANAADRDPKRVASPMATEATSAAEMAAVEDVGLTTSCLEVPSRA
jgi:hypothetical protein